MQRCCQKGLIPKVFSATSRPHGLTTWVNPMGLARKGSFQTTRPQGSCQRALASEPSPIEVFSPTKGLSRR